MWRLNTREKEMSLLLHCQESLQKCLPIAFWKNLIFGQNWPPIQLYGKVKNLDPTLGLRNRDKCILKTTFLYSALNRVGIKQQEGYILAAMQFPAEKLPKILNPDSAKNIVHRRPELCSLATCLPKKKRGRGQICTWQGEINRISRPQYFVVEKKQHGSWFVKQETPALKASLSPFFVLGRVSEVAWSHLNQV